MTDEHFGRGFMPARKVWERYGVTSMTLHRWLKDPENDFPKPIYIGRFRYWRFEDIQAWETNQANLSQEA